MCSECAEMAEAVYQTGRIRNAIPTAFPSLLSQVVFQMSNPRFHGPAQLLFDGISSSLPLLNGWDVVLK